MQFPKNGRTILVVEDEPEVRDYLEMALRCLGYSVELAQDGEEAMKAIESPKADFAAVLLDLMMPQRDGMETLEGIRGVAPGLPVIIVSGASSPFNIVEAMKKGATDFLCKPVVHEHLRNAVLKALDTKTLEFIPPARTKTTKTKAFLGNNPRMKEIQALAAHIGWSEAPVLIQGETGSGKEVLARELHAQSPRAGKPLLKLNCAALPSELVESELFGYERGAFTGAFQKKSGLFELADGGTILLDEIGDMEFRLQAKLLQVLQDHEFQRIGGKETIRVDVRVIAATHRDLESCIAERTFREDLFYRLNVINLHLPPLRERKDDIVPLAEFLLKKHATAETQIPPIPADLRQAMMSYHWPGNVRELENFARKLLILRDPALLIRDLQAKATRKPPAAAPAAAVAEPVREIQAVPPAADQAAGAPILQQVTKAKQQAEKEAIVAALNSTRWNRKQAAALLQIDYKALLYKMKKLNMDEDVVPITRNDLTATARGY